MHVGDLECKGFIARLLSICGWGTMHLREDGGVRQEKEERGRGWNRTNSTFELVHDAHVTCYCLRREVYNFTKKDIILPP